MQSNNSQNKIFFSSKHKILFFSLVCLVIFLLGISYVYSIQVQKTREVTNIYKGQNLDKQPSDLVHEELKSPLTENTNQNFKNRDEDTMSINDNNKSLEGNFDQINFNFDKIMKPVEGRITNDFSDDELTYCKTMEDFRIHDAIDIEAEIGTNVKAVCDGRIEEVIINDEMYGTCILIRHNPNFCTRYCGLQEVVLVKEGDLVKKGRTIGGIGTPGICEISEPPHLHFQVIKDHQTVNPSEFL